jgi:hypothetical protein
MNIYHGSPTHGITEFSLDDPRFESVEGSGVYLTLNYKLARGYAGSEGCVYICKFDTEAVFDATDKNEFNELLRRLSKKINFNILDVDFVSETVNGLVSGQYQITDQNSSGLFWQIKNLLFNNEDFMNFSDSEDKIDIIKVEIDEYLDQHPIVKYNDKSLGLIYLCKIPSYLKIIKSIIVGSDEDLELL